MDIKVESEENLTKKQIENQDAKYLHMSPWEIYQQCKDDPEFTRSWIKSGTGSEAGGYKESLDNFIDKASSAYKTLLKVLEKTITKSQDRFRRKLRVSSDEELRMMEKQFSEEGGSPILQSLLYEEMRRRHML